MLFTLNSYSQVDEALKNMQLYEGSVYVTYGHRITEIFSELEFRMGVGIFPKTNIAYLNYQQLIRLMQDSAKRESWTQEKYIESRNQLHNNAMGGRIVLYVERYSQYDTNLKLFFVIIRNKDEKKLREINFPNKPASLVTTSLFSNYTFIDIPEELPENFFVYVNHKLTEHLSDTKFLVEQNAAPLFKEE
jgi:hypothetical protein